MGIVPPCSSLVEDPPSGIRPSHVRPHEQGIWLLSDILYTEPYGSLGATSIIGDLTLDRRVVVLAFFPRGVSRAMDELIQELTEMCHRIESVVERL